MEGIYIHMAANTSHELVIDSIYTALIQLMEKYDYEDIKITDIVQRAGVSRMTYYRNFDTKDDILTKRLHATLDMFEEKLRDFGNITEEEYWTEFFETFKTDPVILNIVKAGLIQPLVSAHKDFTIHMYEKIFHWDMNDDHNKMIAYQRMGSMTGLMLYAIEENPQSDSYELARLIISENEKISN